MRYTSSAVCGFALVVLLGLAGCVDESHCPKGDCSKPRICDTRSQTCWPEGSSPLDVTEGPSASGSCMAEKEGVLACSDDRTEILRCDGETWNLDTSCPTGAECEGEDADASCISLLPQITIYTTYQLDVEVYWDDQTAGTLGRYYTSGSGPTCGLPTGNTDPALEGNSWITIETPVGTHTIAATATDGHHWGPGEIEIVDGCQLYVLR